MAENLKPSINSINALKQLVIMCIMQQAGGVWWGVWVDRPACPMRGRFRRPGVPSWVHFGPIKGEAFSFDRAIWFTSGGSLQGVDRTNII